MNARRKTKMRILIFAGGTGGHVMPALAVAEQLRAQGAEVLWVGTSDGVEAAVAPRAGIPFRRIWIKGVRGAGAARWLTMPFLLTWAMLQSLLIFLLWRPRCVLGMGGFVSGPGGLVARLLLRRLVVHEQNTVAGMTNRWLARLSAEALCGFPKSDGLENAKWVGNPVRREVCRVRAPQQRLAKRSGALRVLILGGSLGAQVFNRHAPELLARAHAKSPIEIWHQCGRERAGPISERYLAARMVNRVFSFIEDMDAAYSWCDLAICRAGAVTIAEICAAGVAAFLVPYPHAAGGHQHHNARYLQERNAARLLPQEEFVGGGWLRELGALQGERGRLLELAEAARDLARPQAAEHVARICLGRGFADA
ncbi:MAG: undecaprenyldiphospho-muramoylpentapeptide beta-N-acetylglucosaminyltransferase [Gammaproteobacteria bacterium]|nr:undecaprenyldiphospho-muramoylpentapeptide beta-N-acetylglucosaminyltransferase [Gammaproteobacteria bacterium]